MAKYHFLNGTFVTEDQAVLPITDLSILRGYAVFDYFRIIKGVPLFKELHLKRFKKSASYLDINLPYSKKEMSNTILKLTKKNKISNGAMRLMATGGDSSSDGYSVSPPNVFFQAMPYPEFPEHFGTKGVKIMLEPYIREYPLVKSSNYIHGIMLRKKLKESGNNFALYHHEGVISESDRSNFFIINQKGALQTSENNVLLGISRHNIIEMMREKMPVLVRDITLEELSNAKEAFITSSAKGVMPVVRIDNNPIGDGQPGELTLSISAAYEEFIQNYVQANQG